MRTRNLSAIQMDRLSEFTTALYERVSKQNENEQLYSDLSGLYCDIVSELTKNNSGKAQIIFEYASLLCQEALLHCGEEAYVFGIDNKGKSDDEVLLKYLLNIAEKKNELDYQIQMKYIEIQSLLGDYKGLLYDFTEVFQKVHGVIKNHVQEFITMGQKEMGDVA